VIQTAHNLSAERIATQNNTKKPQEASVTQKAIAAANLHALDRAVHVIHHI